MEMLDHTLHENVTTYKHVSMTTYENTLKRTLRSGVSGATVDYARVLLPI